MSDDPPSWLLGGLLAVAEPHTDVSTFDVVRDGARFRVEFSAGSSAHITFTAPYRPATPPLTQPVPAAGYRAAAQAVLRAPRPLRVELRRETDADRRAKGRGINRETQTGDARFDAEVYVDSPSDPRVLAALLASPEVRAAVRLLLDRGFGSVWIDDAHENIVAKITSFPEAEAHREVALAIADAFATLVRSLPAVARDPARAARPPWQRRTAALVVVAGALVFAEIPAFFGLALPARCIVHTDDGEGIVGGIECVGPLAVALVATLALAGLAAFLLTHAARPAIVGRSDSLSRLRTLGCAGFAVAFGLTLLLATALVFRAT